MRMSLAIVNARNQSYSKRFVYDIAYIKYMKLYGLYESYYIVYNILYPIYYNWIYNLYTQL